MSSRADTILRTARTSGAQALSPEIGSLRVVWSMRVSARWHASPTYMEIVEGWIIGAAIDKTFAAAQKNLCQSRRQRAVAAEAFRSCWYALAARAHSDRTDSLLSSFLPFAESAKGRCPRSGRRGHEHHH